MLRSGIRIPVTAKSSVTTGKTGDITDRHLAGFFRDQGLTSEEISRTLRLLRTGGKLCAM